MELHDVRPGDQLPVLRRRPTTADLFTYSAATWNKGLIHFDQDFARVRGYPQVLVHSHLHGAYLLAALTDWLGDPRLVRSMSVTVRRPAFAGDVLLCSGTVERAEQVESGFTIDVALVEHREGDGEPCAYGRAQVMVERREA